MNDNLTVSEPSLTEWDEFVNDTDSNATIFSSSIWLKMFNANREISQNSFKVIAFRYNNKIVGGVSYLNKSPNRAMIPLLSSYSGITYLKGYSDFVLSSFCQWALNQKFKEINLAIPEPDLNIALLEEYGFSCQERQTYMIDVDVSQDVLWQAIDNSKKRQIKKAERAGIVISTELPHEETAYELLKDTFSVHGDSCPVNYPLFCSVLNDTEAVCHCAYQNANLIGYVVSNKYKQIAYYTIASANDTAKQLGVPSLLVWKVLCYYAAQNDVHAFDFMGANIPSIAKFKEGFAPYSKKYYIVNKTNFCIKALRKMLRYVRKFR